MPALESSSERPLPVNPRRLVGLYAAKSSVLCLYGVSAQRQLPKRPPPVCVHALPLICESGCHGHDHSKATWPLLAAGSAAESPQGLRVSLAPPYMPLRLCATAIGPNRFQSRFCAVTPQAHAVRCFRLRCVLATCRSCVRAVNEATGIARHLAGSDPKASSTLRRKRNPSSCIGSGLNESQQRVAPTQRTSAACLQSRNTCAALRRTGATATMSTLMWKLRFGTYCRPNTRTLRRRATNSTAHSKATGCVLAMLRCHTPHTAQRTLARRRERKSECARPCITQW